MSQRPCPWQERARANARARARGKGGAARHPAGSSQSQPAAHGRIGRKHSDSAGQWPLTAALERPPSRLRQLPPPGQPPPRRATPSITIALALRRRPRARARWRHAQPITRRAAAY
jgi:hypothetical protein